MCGVCVSTAHNELNHYILQTLTTKNKKSEYKSLYLFYKVKIIFSSNMLYITKMKNLVILYNLVAPFRDDPKNYLETVKYRPLGPLPITVLEVLLHRCLKSETLQPRRCPERGILGALGGSRFEIKGHSLTQGTICFLCNISFSLSADTQKSSYLGLLIHPSHLLRHARLHHNKETGCRVEACSRQS